MGPGRSLDVTEEVTSRDLEERKSRKRRKKLLF
jgi:hypothetical protein